MTSSLLVEAPSSPVSIGFSQHLTSHGYSCTKEIGKGAYSTVQLAWCTKWNKNVALKIIDERSQSDFVIRFLPRELQIVPLLRHSNVIKVHEILHSGPIVCMVQEYASGGDLLQRIKNVKRISENDSKFYFRQLIEALMYLKTIKVVHRDLKCENIFLDDLNNVKLGDFGFSRIMQDDEESRTFCGSRAYVAPEVLKSKPYCGFTVDLWSSGVVLFVMVTGLMPYNDKDPKRMLNKQMEHRVTMPRGITLSEELKLLIYDILHPIPSMRLPYEEIIKSKWLAKTRYYMRTEHSEMSTMITELSDKINKNI